MSNSQRLVILTLALVAFGAPGDSIGAFNLDPAASIQGADGASRSDSYRAGQKSLEAERWEEAAESFREAFRQSGSDADGALYWQAYSLFKLNRLARAQLALEELEELFPQSSWVDDARALAGEIGRREGREPDGLTSSDQEIKLVALNTLIHLDWERAQPILQELLDGSTSPKMVERALFVISQSDDPGAFRMLADIARDQSKPERSSQAIEYLSFFDRAEAHPLLRELYGSMTDREVREGILEAMMVGGDLESLLGVARTEPDERLRRTAVEQLGVLGATTELHQLYAAETSPEVKGQILEAFMIAGDKASILQLARTEPDAELRSTAIEQLGVMSAATDLRELYLNESSAEIREEIVQALALSRAVEALGEIARADASADVRQQAIEGLGLIRQEEARKALWEIYRGTSDAATRSEVIESFMIGSDVSRLIEIARTETDPELKKKAIEALSQMNNDQATEFLLGLLRNDA